MTVWQKLSRSPRLARPPIIPAKLAHPLVRLRTDERGTVAVIMAFLLPVMIGGMSLGFEVVNWYPNLRSMQNAADAAALAAAADLPSNTGQATIDAQSNATKNGASSGGLSIAYSTTYTPNDTVTVRASTTAPSYFLKAIGINSAAVKASATATAMPLTAAYGSAPFAVYYTQPELAGPGCPCYGVSTTLNYNKVGPGGFEIINIDGSSGGSGQTTLADWILNGCACSTSTPTWLWGDAGAKFNSSEVNNALSQRIGQILLFPVYDASQAGGSNMQYHVIAFVGFKVTSFKFNGSNNGTISGSFQKVTWRGSGGSSSPGTWSATTIQLTS
jgi:Flp pilus assembly protein TadG